MPEIEVRRAGVEGSRSRFRVTVEEAGSATTHEVTLSWTDFERLGGRSRSPEEFVRRCFEFLLAREPKESILPSFDVAVIGTYFPEFEREIAG